MDAAEAGGVSVGTATMLASEALYNALENAAGHPLTPGEWQEVSIVALLPLPVVVVVVVVVFFLFLCANRDRSTYVKPVTVSRGNESTNPFPHRPKLQWYSTISWCSFKVFEACLLVCRF